MISQKEYMQYFQKISRQHTDIRHTDREPRFFRLRDPRDLSTKLDKADGTILMVETPENNYLDNGADNYMKERKGAFAVLRRLKKQDDFIQMDDIMDDCEIITEDIMKLMMKAHRDFDDQLFGYLPLSSFSSFRVGPIFNEFYGVRMEFKFGDSIALCVNENKWNFNLGQ
jgi:hypothetical protein